MLQHSCFCNKPQLNIYILFVLYRWKNNRNDVDRIGGVMVSLLAISAVDRGFESRLGQTKDYKIGICCFSAKHTTLRTKTGWFGIRIMCPSGVTCLTVDCCFSELAL
jgi:hypothetical protein